MKERIEELAQEICLIPARSFAERLIKTYLNCVHNEALELAAMECDRFAKESSNPMNFSDNCAAAIRKLKVTE